MGPGTAQPSLTHTLTLALTLTLTLSTYPWGQALPNRL